MKIEGEYKLVVIDSVYENSDDSIVTEFFPKIIRSKRQGYSSRHGENYLPLSTEDFLATHLAVCKLINNKYEPISVVKILSLQKSLMFGLEHSMLEQMKNNYSELYYAFVSRKIRQYQRRSDCSYTGGFTINKKLLSSPEEVELQKEILCSAIFRVHIDRGLEGLFAFSAKEMGTDKLLSKWGIEPIVRGKNCETVFLKTANQLATPSFTDISDISSYSKEMIEKYKNLWIDREDNNLASKTSFAA